MKGGVKSRTLILPYLLKKKITLIIRQPSITRLYKCKICKFVTICQVQNLIIGSLP